MEGGENNRTVFSRGFVLRVDGQDEASVIERIAKFVDPLSSCLACIKQRAHDRGYDLARDRDPLLVREKHRWFATLDGPEINFHQRARTLGGCRPLLTCFHRRTRLLSLRSLLTSRFSSSLPSLLRIVHTDPVVRGSFRKPRFLAPSFLKIFSPYIDTKLPFSLSFSLFPSCISSTRYRPGVSVFTRYSSLATFKVEFIPRPPVARLVFERALFNLLASFFYIFICDKKDYYPRWLGIQKSRDTTLSFARYDDDISGKPDDYSIILRFLSPPQFARTLVTNRSENTTEGEDGINFVGETKIRQIAIIAIGGSASGSGTNW